MDFTGFLFIAFMLSYIGGMIYVANQIEAARVATTGGSLPGDTSQTTILRWMHYGLIGLTFSVGLVVMQAALFSDMAADLNGDLEDLRLEINMASAVITFVLALAACIVCFRVVSSAEVRQSLQQAIGQRGSYNADSPVHTTAILLMFALVIWTLVVFVLQGGISGMAQDLAERGIDAGDLLFQCFIQVVISLLGVGLALRRDWPQTLDRLGLRPPTSDDLKWGVGIGLLMIGVMYIGSALWEIITSPEIYTEQTAAAEQMSRAISSMPLAFLMAASAAVGEEIWIRGALQPVFGLGATSVFFVLLHTQFTLTPAALIILIVSLAFGWLRLRFSTTAAIIAHFTYNFVPLMLVLTLA